LSYKKFQFAKIDNIEVATFDPSLEKFYEQGIEGTVKEDVQNSTDAHLKEQDEPVELKITLDTISKQNIPGIEEVYEHIDSLQGSNEYTKKKVDYMKQKGSLQEVKVLTIEDSNTKGLTGAKYGQSDSKEDTFGIYTYKKGVHYVDSDGNVEVSRGWSHGIGKIANNAASDIHLMYFANCDAYGEKHLGGSIHLIEHNLNGQNYRSTGYFTNKDEEKAKFYPFENIGFHEIFKKDTRGLKIIIPYLRAEFSNLEDILRAVCDNFFISILNKKIRVTIEDKVNSSKVEITDQNIGNIVGNSKFYETDVGQMKKSFTPLYVNTYLKKQPMKVMVKDLKEEYNFKLYFQYNEEIPTGRVAVVRTMGMKIEDFKVKNNVRKPFNAVLIGGSKEDSFLKSLENESHTQISAAQIKDEYEKKNAKKFLSNLNKEITSVIEAHIKLHNPTDGVIDTKDLLYETETAFKNDLSSGSEKVELSSKKSVRKKVEKERRDKGEGTGSSSNSKDNRKRKPRKLKSSNKEEEKKETIIMPTTEVERLMLKNNELIKFDFKNIEGSKEWKRCDISFIVVDGMGKEYDKEYDLTMHYDHASDKITKNQYRFDSRTIYDIELDNASAMLELKLKENMGTPLKFLYKVEVDQDDL